MLRARRRVALVAAAAAVVHTACGRTAPSPAAAAAVDAQAAPATGAPTPVPVATMEASTETVAPGDSAPPLPEAGGTDAATADRPREAGPPAPRARVGKPFGAPCSSGECGPGLSCCETGFTGHCGGALMPDMQYDPCVMKYSCTRGPCTPLSMPP